MSCKRWSAPLLFSDADRAAVVLVFGVVTVVLLLCYGFTTGGGPRLIAASIFGLEFMVEGHHIVKTIVRGAYFPGAVTAIAFVVLGALILATARREFRRASPELDDPRLRLSNVEVSLVLGALVLGTWSVPGPSCLVRFRTRRPNGDQAPRTDYGLSTKNQGPGRARVETAD